MADKKPYVHPPHSDLKSGEGGELVGDAVILDYLLDCADHTVALEILNLLSIEKQMSVDNILATLFYAAGNYIAQVIEDENDACNKIKSLGFFSHRLMHSIKAEIEAEEAGERE